MKNKYFILRHGQSRANVAQIILSNLEDGKKEEFTLTKEGENQVKVSVENAKKVGWLDKKTIIYSSPFSRCKKTAEIAKEILGVNDDIIFDDRLRERWFGEHEQTHSSAYQKIWDADKVNSEHKEFGVESAKEVQERTLLLIKDLENKYKNKNILLISHGDVLQILQTGTKNISPALHRQIKHLETGEIRELELDN